MASVSTHSHAESVIADQPAFACATHQTQAKNHRLFTVNDTTQPIHISADSAEGLLKQKQVKLDGNVHIVSGQQSLLADHAVYDIDKGDVATRGKVTLSQPGIEIRADRVNYHLPSHTGQAIQSDYLITDIPARGQAKQIRLLDAGQSEYEQINYTTCPPGRDDWQLQAEKLHINQTAGVGIAHNTILSFMQVPIAYLPWITFPIDDRRKSGLLIPSIGYGDKQGLDLTIPYYLNLAPNYDLTLAPRIMSERGVMLGGEFRFLATHTQGAVRAEYLPQDNKNAAYAKNRGSFSLNTRSRLGDHLSSRVNIEHVTDDDYLDDLGNPLSLSTASLLQRQAQLVYQTTDLSLAARLKNYQVLNDGSEPYSILPQIRLDMQLPGKQSGLLYHLESEMVHFTKDDDGVEGTRLDIYPGISLPLQDDYYHLTPKIGARYTQYALNNQTDGLDESPNRRAGIFSLDGGLYFERDTTYFGSAAQQALEPRIYYLYTTRHRHDDIPLFDTSLYSFNVASLFRENRFNGVDRLGDANQISLSLTTRYNDSKTGQEKLNASIGQIVYLQDRQVTLADGHTEQDNSSAIAGEFTAYIDKNWQTRGNLAWDINNAEIDQALAQIHYRQDDDHLFNLSYRLRDEVSDQLDVSTIWPISKKIKALGHWRYALDEQQTWDAIAGIEYGTCCWKVRALLHRHTDIKGAEDTAFFVQLELNGLGKLGSDFEDLLTNTIYGYRREN